MSIIPKQASDTTAYRRSFSFFKNARSAWGKIIEYYRSNNPNTVFLLPSYIGYSVNEGSGIFDPIREQKAKYKFYALNKSLEIDFEDVKLNVSEHKGEVVVLLVHYFGFTDKNYDDICDWLDSEKINYVEDCAHAMLTDLIGGSCGRRGSFSFYSVHKLLPYQYGGNLVTNANEIQFNNEEETNLDRIDIFSHDLASIYKRRRKNYEYLSSLILEYKGIQLLQPCLPEGIGPQSLPILVESENRDDIYFKMNEAGFGFVSLYHTMIKELQHSEFTSATFTAKHITNLPIHQDCSKADLKQMATEFLKVLETL